MSKINELKKELETFERLKSEMLKEHEEEYVLIKGEKVIGFFEKEKDGITKGFRMFSNRGFLIKKIMRIEPIYRFMPVIYECDCQCHQ